MAEAGMQRGIMRTTILGLKPRGAALAIKNRIASFLHHLRLRVRRAILDLRSTK